MSAANVETSLKMRLEKFAKEGFPPDNASSYNGEPLLWAALPTCSKWRGNPETTGSTFRKIQKSRMKSYTSTYNSENPLKH
ncbi:MAG: hypothetical protein KME32_33230 [Mojavia pulchra JT2-VF2]|uniref:Uncharacterized protein n=1 Tax=Mojavia pulchra JT2-VF2 TaxID=287848 RepID=A0A951UJG8_9NOST|nr:hypothetical protein [Mojavia pulchra JT2-VF2]